MKSIKLLSVITIIILSLTIVSCSSDDDASNESSCIDLVNQSVQGSFRGTNFVSPAGFYTVSTFGENTIIRGKIYVKEAQNSDCIFPTFEGNDDTILFSIPSLEAQTIILSENGENTLNFNRIATTDNGPVTEIELAECGTIEITSYDENAGIIQGTVVAKGQFGSTVNGTFTLELCKF